MQLGTRHRQNMRQLALVLFCALTLLMVLAGCESAATSPSIPTPSLSMAMVPLQLDLPAKAWNAPITGKVPDSLPLHVGLTFKLNQQVLDQMSQKGVVRPDQSVSANDIVSKLGVSDADYQRLKQFFGISGGILQLSKTHTSATLDIKAASLAQLLQTRFVQHTLDKRVFYTPDPQQKPQIPAALAANILAVTGLDNYSLPPLRPTHPQQQPAHQANQQAAKASANCDPHAEATRQLVAQTYGNNEMWKQGWHGENMTVNLVEIEAASMNDLRNYFTCVGFKGTFDFITVDGAPKPGPTDVGETALDIEMVAGFAPAAHIKAYQTNPDLNQPITHLDDFWTKTDDILQRIIDDNASHHDPGSIVSISLAVSENYITGEVFKAMSQRLAMLTYIEQMAVFVSSGDCGAYAGGVLGTLSTDYPTTDPSVISVGGTTFLSTKDTILPREIGWTGAPIPDGCQNDWGSGGGLSTVFKKPPWQRAPGVDNQYSNGYRQVPDIAAVASGLPLMYYRGQWTTGGGTSAASPIFAAGMALVNQALLATKGFYVHSPDTFYAVQAHAGTLKPYYDEVQGSDLYYQAGPGWDYMTGLGSPNLPDIYKVIAATTTA